MNLIFKIRAYFLPIVIGPFFVWFLTNFKDLSIRIFFLIFLCSIHFLNDTLGKHFFLKLDKSFVKKWIIVPLLVNLYFLLVWSYSFDATVKFYIIEMFKRVTLSTDWLCQDEHKIVSSFGLLLMFYQVCNQRQKYEFALFRLQMFDSS